MLQALQFAKSIPKPKPKKPQVVPPQSQPEHVASSSGDDQYSENVGCVISRLDELEAEHEHARQQVEAIKKSLGF